jgi:hypothetical protein
MFYGVGDVVAVAGAVEVSTGGVDELVTGGGGVEEVSTGAVDELVVEDEVDVSTRGVVEDVSIEGVDELVPGDAVTEEVPPPVEALLELVVPHAPFDDTSAPLFIVTQYGSCVSWS